MKKRWVLIIFLFVIVRLSAQQNKTVFEHLKVREVIELDWVHQQYLPDSGSRTGDYPLFPDQLKDGEGEMHARIRLEKSSKNSIKVWVDYIFCLQYPERVPLDLSKGLYAEGLPEEALVYPKIEDTRYHFDELTSMPEFYQKLYKIPIIFNKNEGITNKEWFEEIEDALEKTSLYFNAHHLEMFLRDLLTAGYVKKTGYYRTIQYHQFNRVSVHFYKPILSPQKTVISGIIKNPISKYVTLDYQNHESWVKRLWSGTNMELDSTGHFSFVVSIREPSSLHLSQTFFPIPIYAEPGDSIKLEIDANGIYRKTKFSGDNTVNNQTLLDFYHHIRGDTVIMITPDFSILKKSQREHLVEVQQRERKELHYLASKKEEITPNFHSFLDRKIRFTNANRLWYNASFFKNRPNGHLITDYTTHCQKLTKRPPTKSRRVYPRTTKVVPWLNSK